MTPNRSLAPAARPLTVWLLDAGPLLVGLLLMRGLHVPEVGGGPARGDRGIAAPDEDRRKAPELSLGVEEGDCP